MSTYNKLINMYLELGWNYEDAYQLAWIHWHNETKKKAKPNKKLIHAGYICSLIALVLVFFVGCNPTAPESNYMDNAHQQNFDYPIEASFNIDSTLLDTDKNVGLEVGDPLITLNTEGSIKDVLVSVLLSDGVRVSIPCHYEDKGMSVYIYNDELYGASNASAEVVSFRFDVVFYGKGK